MLIFGDSNTIIGANSILSTAPNIILNMSSACMDYVAFYNLFPVVNVDPESREFDINYANYLLSCDQAFNEMMSIMYSIYSGINVLVMIGPTEIKYMVAESLLKFIQQRYGYNGYLIQNPEDVIALNESSFTVPGLYNFDIDKERYTPVLFQLQQDFGGEYQ